MQRGGCCEARFAVLVVAVCFFLSHHWWKPLCGGWGSATAFDRAARARRDGSEGPCVLQVVFIGGRWPCRSPNIIWAIVVCRAEQTLKRPRPPLPPAAATDSTLHKNMQIHLETANISIKPPIPGWCFQPYSCLERKKKECIILIGVQTSCPVLALSSSCQYHLWETLLSRLVGLCPGRPPPPQKKRKTWLHFNSHH